MTEELAAWLADAARRAGVSQGRIIREQLERARKERPAKRYMRWAGTISGPADLSARRGFSKP